MAVTQNKPSANHVLFTFTLADNVVSLPYLFWRPSRGFLLSNAYNCLALFPSSQQGPSLTSLLTHGPVQVSEHHPPPHPPPAPVHRFLTGSTLFSTLPSPLDKLRTTHGGDCVPDSWALGGHDVRTGSLCLSGRAPTPAVRPPKGPCEGPEGASFEQHVANMWMIPRGERVPQQCSLQGKGVSDRAHTASHASKASR